MYSCSVALICPLKLKNLTKAQLNFFFSEFEKVESRWNVISEIDKNRDAK